MNRFEFKFRKRLSGKIVWDFQSYFKWDWLEFEDFRKYSPWDDIRYINWKISWKYKTLFINLFRQQKDANIEIYFDINRNWNWVCNGLLVKDLVFDIFSDIVLYSNKYKANINLSYNYKNKIIKEFIWKDFVLAYWLIKKTEKIIPKYSLFYKTNINDFLNKLKLLKKRSIIIIFSDFLWLSETDYKLLKLLKLNNELLLFDLNIDKWIWLNYNRFNLNVDSNDKLKMFNVGG